MSILDSVGGFVRDAGGAIADTAKSGAKAAGDAFDTAVETAKAGANAVVSTVREVDAAKEQVGSWIDSKAQQLEHKVDEGRAWLRENGGVAGKVASDQIGLVEGVATSVYGAGKGLVQLADGVSPWPVRSSGRPIQTRTSRVSNPGPRRWGRWARSRI